MTTTKEAMDYAHRLEAMKDQQNIEIRELRAALETAFVAMKLAAALPAVQSEYDFGAAIASADRALRT